MPSKIGSRDMLPVLVQGLWVWPGLSHTDGIEIIRAISHLWSHCGRLGEPLAISIP